MLGECEIQLKPNAWPWALKGWSFATEKWLPPGSPDLLILLILLILLTRSLEPESCQFAADVTAVAGAGIVLVLGQGSLV